VGVSHLSFYGREWLLLHGAILFAWVSCIIGMVALIAWLVVKRYSPARWPTMKRVLLALWVVVMIAAICDLAVLDVLQRPDLVPEWLGGSRHP
jgi:MFS superfamily sulfate permease-like transporter